MLTAACSIRSTRSSRCSITGSSTAKASTGRCRDTMEAAGLGRGPDTEAYIRILLTRGVGELSYDADACPVPSVVVIVKPQVDPAPEVYAQGVKLAMVDVIRNHPGTVN